MRTNLRVARHAWNIVYYGSFTRSDGLLIGCLLAALLGFHPRVPARWVRTLVGGLAVGAIVLDLVIADRVRHAYYPTFLTTWGLLAFNLGVAVVVLHVIYSPRAPLPRALSIAPLVWIGRRSYGIYVAHVIVDEGFVSAHLRSAPWMGVAAAVTLVLAARVVPLLRGAGAAAQVTLRHAARAPPHDLDRAPAGVSGPRRPAPRRGTRRGR